MDDKSFFQHWNIVFSSRLPLTPSGSPNRSVSRFVILDQQERKYIAEGFELRKRERQNSQNRMLEFLTSHGMPGIFPYLRTAGQAHGVTCDSCFWQVRPWQDADPAAEILTRDPEKFARICADLLLKLQQISTAADLPLPPNERFYFTAYLPRLSGFAGRKMADLQPEIERIFTRLDDFLNREQKLPPMLAHGDFHPGNILTRQGELSAVIDWEFTGWKHPGYDLALLLGCLGRDDLRWLNGDLAAELQDQLYRQNYLPDCAWEQLTELMAAIRLGWLGEWIDLDDRDLAEQEISYIKFLLNC